jgi:hypothetical protein
LVFQIIRCGLGKRARTLALVGQLRGDLLQWSMRMEAANASQWAVFLGV